jgi:hypothetical protein
VITPQQSAAFYEHKGLMNGEQADAPEDCLNCGEPGCDCQLLNRSDLDELEALCYWCVSESGGFIDPQCPRCDGTGRIDAPDHPDWCRACGMSGTCPDCDPDTYLDARRNR